MIRRAFCFAAVFFLQAHGHASVGVALTEDCADRNVRSQMQRAGLPRENQQGPQDGWCYSHVATELLSVEYGRRLSAADLASQYIKANSSEILARPRTGMQDVFPLGGGFVDLALRAGMEGGVCLEADRPSLSFEDLQEEERLRNLTLQLGVKVPRSAPTSADCLHENVFREFGEQLRPILAAISNQAVIRQLNHSFSRPCEKQTLPSREMRRASRAGEQDSSAPLIVNVNDGLKSGKPVAISFDSRILTRPSSQILTVNPSHAALVVGSRRNSATRECEYLIRNTELGCEAYRSPLKDNCVDNHVWLPGGDLQRVISDSIFLQVR